MAVNHLQNNQPERKFLVEAFGRLPFTGHLVWSKEDASYIYAKNALARGVWDGIENVFWKGKRLAPSEWGFKPGTQAQTVSTYFPNDSTHPGVVTLDYRVPINLAAADTLANPPLRMEGVARTKKSSNYNASGVETDFSYSTNAAREIVQILTDCAKMPNVPTSYASLAAYWLSRIDWGNWIDFRAAHDETETVDYRAIPDFQGFGLRAKYYAGANFQTFVEQFVQPNLKINYAGISPPSTSVTVPLSARFDGYLKFKYSENTTIFVTHDNGIKLTLNGNQLMNIWQDDGFGPYGTDSVNFAATANAFTPVIIDWNDAGVGGLGELKLEWQSASQPREVIPSKYLYPIAEQRKKYESHIWFDTPVTPIFAIDEILRITNSVKQEMPNGKFRFHLLEQLTPSFAFDNSNIIEGTFNAAPVSVLDQNPWTEYSGVMRDADRRFVEPPELPPSVKTERFETSETDNVREVKCYAMTRWQAFKLIKTTMKLEAMRGLTDEFESYEAQSFPPIENDVVTIRHRKTGNVPKTYLIREATDRAVTYNASPEPGSAPRRKFRAHQWEVE